MNWDISQIPRRALNVILALAWLVFLVVLAFSLNALFASRTKQPPQTAGQPKGETGISSQADTIPTGNSVQRGYGGKVELAVIEAVQKEGKANVIISLVEPPAWLTPEVAPSVLKSELASVQDQVLSSLDPSDFRLIYRWTATAGMAGTVLSEDGLRKLADNPHVAGIGIDPIGTGSSD